jgi:hypothetical protein
MKMHEGGVSIWFFIGISLLVNGVLITGAGVWEFLHPPLPEKQVVLFHYHANVWWGALLLVLGLIYCFKYSPSRDA